LNSLVTKWLEKVNSSIHRTTGRIPNKIVMEENLYPFDSIPEFRISITEEKKVSSDCFVSYKGNRYSVP
jgi:hypothetical protein